MDIYQIGALAIIALALAMGLFQVLRIACAGVDDLLLRAIGSITVRNW